MKNVYITRNMGEEVWCCGSHQRIDIFGMGDISTLCRPEYFAVYRGRFCGHMGLSWFLGTNRRRIRRHDLNGVPLLHNPKNDRRQHQQHSSMVELGAVRGGNLRAIDSLRLRWLHRRKTAL